MIKFPKIVLVDSGYWRVPGHIECPNEGSGTVYFLHLGFPRALQQEENVNIQTNDLDYYSSLFTSLRPIVFN